MYLGLTPVSAFIVLLLPLLTRADLTRGVCGAVSDNPDKPLNTRCNFEGVPKKSNSFSTTQTSSYEACRDKCLAGKLCLTFSYTPTDGNAVDSSTAGTCAIYRRRLSGKALKAKDSGVFFWNRDCFVADYYDFTPVQNGDFSGSTLDPWVSLNTDAQSIIQLNNGAGQISASCADNRCQAENQRSNPMLQQLVPLCAGVKYRISHDAMQLPYLTSKTKGYLYAYFYIVYPDGFSSWTFMVLQDLTSDGLIDYSVDGVATYYSAGTTIHEEYDFVAKQTGPHKFIFFILAGEGGDSTYTTMQFDNLVVEALPEGS